MVATEIPTEVVAGAFAFGTLVFIGMASWALLLLVRLSTIVARLEASQEDNERRIAWLEDQHDLDVRRSRRGGMSWDDE